MNTTQRNNWDALSMKEKADMMKVAVQNGIYNLDDIRQAYNEYAKGGNIYDGTTETTQQMNAFPRPITTGGAGYIPPVATNVQQIVDKAKGLGRYTIGYIKNKFGFPTPYIIDLSNEDVVQVTPDTDESQLQTILTNDFVEDKTRGYRLAKDFKNTNDTIIGDRYQIPLSKISTYYGVENGKLKAGPLDTFNDSTVVAPNRAKYVGRIKEFHEGDEEARKELDKVVTKDIENYNEEHGYRPTFSEQLLYHTGFPFIFQPHPAKILRNRVGYDESVRLINGFVENHQDLREKMRPWVITENNDTIRGVEFNSNPKILFGNEKGEGLFVSDPKANLDSLNNWLSQHPSYPIMVDNGRYSDFQLSNPSLDSYAGVGEKDNLFVIGTKKKALGGPLVELANKYEDGGPYKPGTIYGRPTEEGLKTVSPEFDALLIGRVAANAVREAAGKLLNSGIEGTARQRAAITSRRFGREMAKRKDEVKGWSRTLMDDIKDSNYADVPLDLKGLARNVWETGRYIKNTPERYVENTLPKFYRNVFRRTYNNTKPAIPMMFSDPENNE